MASPNYKKSLVESSPDTSASSTPGKESPPPRYDVTDEGYIGSKNVLINKMDNGDCELTMEMNNMKPGDSDDSSSDNSVSSTTSIACSVEAVTTNIHRFFNENSQTIYRILAVIAIIAFHTFLIIAMVLDFQRALVLFVLTCIAYFFVGYNVLKKLLGKKVTIAVKPVFNSIQQKWHIIRWITLAVVVLAVILFLVLCVKPDPSQMISCAGMAMFILILFIFSRHPSKVNWRPIVWGIALQFAFGAMILRWEGGFNAIRFVGSQVNTFLNFSASGANFVFGDKYKDHMFAFQVLPVIILFSTAISMLYHLGVMQVVIGKIAWLMQITMGTAPTESLSCAANIFIGQTEAPILIRPFLKDMTKSELHAVMTGGFATIAGSVMAAYVIGYKIPIEHLLCASVMNAPIALGVSKLFYPETEESKTKNIDNVEMDRGSERNLIEAAAAGASQAVGLVANIAANLIAFIALLHCLNAVLGWVGGMVGFPQLTFQVICSYIFMPVAFLMGVSWEDAGIVGELLGTKLFINEFIAYETLSKFMANRRLCEGVFISARSEIIATYALCGFANLSSVGVQLGGIGPMAPSRKSDLAEVAMRALMAGTIATLMTACVAGMLVSEGEPLMCPVNATMSNITLLNGTYTNNMLSNSTYTILNTTVG